MARLWARRLALLLWVFTSAGALALPAASRTAEPLPPSVEAAVREQYASPDFETRYLSGTADLNGDGRPEVLVHVVGPMACGTGGCPTLVFTPGESGYTLLATISVSRPPVRVSPRVTTGWRDLIVDIGGGGAAAAHAELAFDGKSYPENPTVAPARPVENVDDAQVVIPDFDSFDDATPLPPDPNARR